MVIAVVNNNAVKGTRTFELVDTASQLHKKWTPPRNIRPDQIQNALLAACEHFADGLSSRPISMPLDPNYTPSSDTPLQDYVQFVFMPRKLHRIAERTRDSWQSYLDNRIYPQLGSKAIGSITTSNLMDFELGMQAEGLSISTVRKYHSLLKGIFRMAFTTDVISADPMAKLDRPSPREDEIVSTKVEAYTAAEVAHIESCLAEEPLQWQVYLSLLIDTGMRNGECCGLTWRDINFTAKTIAISQALGYTPAKGIYVTTPKNRKQRQVSMSNDLAYLLFRYYQECAPSTLDSYLFHQKESDKPMHPHSPGRHLKRFAKRHGISDLHPHKLRHTYASIAITEGADVASFTLRVYTTANVQSMKRASDVRRRAVSLAAAGSSLAAAGSRSM